MQDTIIESLEIVKKIARHRKGESTFFSENINTFCHDTCSDILGNDSLNLKNVMYINYETYLSIYI